MDWLLITARLVGFDMSQCMLMVSGNGPRPVSLPGGLVYPDGYAEAAGAVLCCAADLAVALL